MDRSGPTIMYRKLAGRAANLWGYTRLYLGPDHLLQAESTGYTETYKRFYFRDVQALVVVRTGYGSAERVALGLCAAVALVLAGPFLLTGDPELAWPAAVLGAIGLVCMVALGLSLLAGPGCRCVLRTAVQTERLPSLNQYRRALQTVAQLRPLIEQAQATLSLGLGAPGSEPSPADAPPVLPPNPWASPPGSEPGQPAPAQPPS